MLATSNPVIGRRWRGEHLESQHHGVWALVDVDGRVLDSDGDPDQTIFARSSSKSLQAVPFVMSGAIARFGLDDRHLALALASHSGENMHVDAASHMLAAAGLDERHLQCGPSKPLFAVSDRVASPICHCCSGKHAGFLAATVALGADPAMYLDAASPVQQQVRSAILTMTGCTDADISVEIDGCSAPTYCLPLQRLAVGIARLCNPDTSDMPDDLRQASRAITNAAARFPEMVAGQEPPRFDTWLMRATNGRLFAKTGADGVQVVGVNGGNVALVAKCDDGSLRAIWPLISEVLVGHGHLTTAEAAELATWTDPSIRNAAGSVTGHHEVVRGA